MTSGRKPQRPSGKRTFSLIVILLNVVLLAFALLCYWRYTSVYQERLREENLGNIANLNQSSALNATALVESWRIKQDDIIQDIDAEDMTLDEALAAIERSNSDGERHFELIGSDYTGFLAERGADGGFIPLSYSNNNYADLKRALDDIEDDAYADICFAPEFTDNATALKYFAIYRHVALESADGGRDTYALMLATESENVLDVLNSQNDFDGQSTVLMDASGNYIVSNGDFKSTNFFQYLKVYNDLSLDARNAIGAEVAANGSGELYYKNAQGQDSVFCYERMTTNGWYCVTSVPLSSFRTPVFNVNYIIYAVVALFLMMGIDVTWLQMINRRLRQSVLREQEASEAKSDFLSRMSHEIRTPLNGIIGLTTLALDRPVDTETREDLENIRVSGQFLAGLVNDILDLSKVESGKVELNPEPYSARDLYKYVQAVVVPLCREKGLAFHMPEPEESYTAMMLDRLRFNQIMFNLLSNAVKYTPSGGTVELFWEISKLPGEREELTIHVKDNGIGMSEEFQKRMFESFSQEHAQTASSGSGLGLAIVSSLVKLMNGTIEVESKQGVGSTFTVRLEAAACQIEAAQEKESEGAELAGKRVLLCEDNPINTMVAKRVLEKWGVLVDTAANGRLGVEAFESSAPGTYDAILMDVMMPELDGLEATRIIRKLDRTDAAAVPIIAMTANAYDTDVQNCVDAGMNAHMGKPIDQDQMKKTLSLQLCGRDKE